MDDVTKPAAPPVPSAMGASVLAAPIPVELLDGEITDPLVDVRERDLLHRVLRIQVAILGELKAQNAEPSTFVAVARALGTGVASIAQLVGAQLEREVWPDRIPMRVGTVITLLIAFTLTFGQHRVWQVLQPLTTWAAGVVAPGLAP